MSAVAASMTFLSATASPTPMLTVILRMRGTCIVFLRSSLALSSGTIFSLYIFFSLAGIVLVLAHPLNGGVRRPRPIALAERAGRIIQHAQCLVLVRHLA